MGKGNRKMTVWSFRADLTGNIKEQKQHSVSLFALLNCTACTAFLTLQFPVAVLQNCPRPHKISLNGTPAFGCTQFLCLKHFNGEAFLWSLQRGRQFLLFHTKALSHCMLFRSVFSVGSAKTWGRLTNALCKEPCKGKK